MPPPFTAPRTKSRATRRRHAAGTLAALLAGAGLAGVALEATALLLVGEQRRFPRHVIGWLFSGRTLLYHQCSHGHWTPVAHRRAGEALARLVAEGLRPK